MINPIKSLTLVTLGSITVAKYLGKNSAILLLACYYAFSSVQLQWLLLAKRKSWFNNTF